MQQARAWVLGGSGAVGRFLLRRLGDAGWAITAPSRRAQPAWSRHIAGLEWQRQDLVEFDAPATKQADVLFGAGPLDLLVEVLQHSPPAPGACIVALSSTSIDTKQISPDPVERRLAQQLAQGEAALRALAVEHAWMLVLIRPTLIYGAGVDRSLSPLRRLAQRWGFLPLPRASRGLRQPVHADDLAAAMLAAAQRPELDGASLVLPGGESLRFDEMVSRTLTTCTPQPRLVRLPGVPLATVAWMMSKVPFGIARSAAAIDRSARDLLVSNADWQRLGLQPRGFQPSAVDFDTEE